MSEFQKPKYLNENPKEGHGKLKPGFDYLPATFEAEVAVAMSEGRKYGRHNYRVASGIKASVYYNAIRRHVMAWWEGEDVDEESGMHHLIKAAASIAVARDSMIAGTFVDNRPPRVNPKWTADLQKAYDGICARHPEQPEFTQQMLDEAYAGQSRRDKLHEEVQAMYDLLKEGEKRD